MTRPAVLFLAGLALAALLPIGCKSAPSGTAPSGDPVRGAVDAALLDLSRKVNQQAQDGWPTHVPLSSSQPPRPVVRIGRLVNSTRQMIDMQPIEFQIAQALMDSGQVVVAANRHEHEAAMDERAYGDSMGDSTEGAAGTGGTEDMAGLMLVGELTDDVTEVDGERTHKVTMMLTITDVVKRASLIKALGEATQVTEE